MPSDDDADNYPGSWKSPATRRREQEARREAREQQLLDGLAAIQALIPATDDPAAELTRSQTSGGSDTPTPPSRNADEYPSEWKSSATRRREQEASRPARERQERLDDMAASHALIPGSAAATSGAGGHLGPSPVSRDDSYPTEWLTRPSNEENH